MRGGRIVRGSPLVPYSNFHFIRGMMEGGTRRGWWCIYIYIYILFFFFNFFAEKPSLTTTQHSGLVAEGALCFCVCTESELMLRKYYYYY